MQKKVVERRLFSMGKQTHILGGLRTGQNACGEGVVNGRDIA